jgi:glycosyltransferase involved in cell wall biosynthesis
VRRERLAFISPVFLFPNDAGGKIRTTNMLRGMKGGSFELVLAAPASPAQCARWSEELDAVCDEFVPWEPAPPRARWARAFDLLDSLPVNVVADRTAAGRQAVRALSDRGDIDLFVFDFVHAAVLAPATMRSQSVCFTHNVEAEIFQRHAEQARDPLRRLLWRSQHAKMRLFEATALGRFQKVIAVSERDARRFASDYGVQAPEAIPTGVDLDFFSWQLPPAVDVDHPPTVVFTGSMNWDANIDGIQWFIREVWPIVRSRCPQARLLVVGRDPPARLRSVGGPEVDFTGFVDDVRPYVHRAHAFVIPLLVGGGTRIKAFEAMAMGCPVVSTAVGTEGLGAEAGRHYLEADEPAAMAEALCGVIESPIARERLSREARGLVEQHFGHRAAAQVFEDICRRTLKAAVP